MSRQQTIAVDFDGVIHSYDSGWGDGTIRDVPVEGAFEAIKKLVRKGYDVVIHSARASSPDKIHEIQQWFVKHGFSPEEAVNLDITNIKPSAIAYIDDRAIRFTSWKDVLNYF